MWINSSISFIALNTKLITFLYMLTEFHFSATTTGMSVSTQAEITARSWKPDAKCKSHHGNFNILSIYDGKIATEKRRKSGEFARCENEDRQTRQQQKQRVRRSERARTHKKWKWNPTNSDDLTTVRSHESFQQKWKKKWTRTREMERSSKHNKITRIKIRQFFIRILRSLERP